LIGFDTNHSNVDVPSVLRVVERSRPLDMSMSGSGTVMAMRWLSGSSAGMSLSGHQVLPPGPSSDVAIHGAPVVSTSQ
jgi:hypothetical protein